MRNFIFLLSLILLIHACKDASMEEEEDIFQPIHDNMKIGAFYYPWYSATTHWDFGYKGDPLLGEYDSQDSAVIKQHLTWAINHGVDFFLVSWFGQNTFEDLTLKNHLFTFDIPSYFKLGVLYETPHLVDLDEEGLINFDDSSTVATIKSDFSYIATNYFDHPNFLKQDGKPVLYMYLSRIFTGDFEKGMQEIRSHLASLGYELYLIGDQVYWQDPNDQFEIDLMKSFDAVSSYNMHASVADIDIDFAENVSNKYEEWYDVCQQEAVGFIPNILTGYDDRIVRPVDNNPVIERSPTKFKEQCTRFVDYLDEDNMILITTWNEFHEYTQCEPTEEYGFDYLDLIKSELANYK